MLYESIKKLVQHGIDTGLTPECERIYTINLLLDVFHEDNWEDVSCDLTDLVLEDILADLLKEAVTRGIIEDSIGYRDLFDTRLMNCLLPRPAQVQNDFWRHYQESPESATQFYYKFSQDSDYIRRYRIKKDRRWTVDTDYGTLDITINLSKPEKIRKPLPLRAMLLFRLTRNVSSVWRTRGMQGASITRPERITASFRSRSMTASGDSSILLMSTTMSTVSCSTENILR